MVHPDMRTVDDTRRAASAARLADLVAFSDINGSLEIDFRARKAVAM